MHLLWRTAGSFRYYPWELLTLIFEEESCQLGYDDWPESPWDPPFPVF